MIELGAGYGRWCIKANAILQLFNPMPAHFIAIEAEPTHFKWLEHHFRDNQLDPKKHTLIEAVISDKTGYVRFCVGEPSTWYGQSIDHQPPSSRIKRQVKNLLRQLLKGKAGQEPPFRMTKKITLTSVLEAHSIIDLIDLDIQGEELKVLTHSMDLIDERVKRLHISTHSAEIEVGLESLLKKHSWKNTNNYKGQRQNITPYGTMQFVDGAQSWLNPKFY